MSASLAANGVNPMPDTNSNSRNLSLDGADTDDQFNTNPTEDESESSVSSSSSDEDDNERKEEALSVEAILYSAGSFHAIARPVFLTMVLASLSAVYVNNENTLRSGAKEFAAAYQVWAIDSSDDTSAGKNLAISIGNTLVMVCVIASLTFGIVLLYKYRCMKFLIGYMILSSASLLGMLGAYMGTVAIEIYRIPIDKISYYLILYNFATVGIVAIFYQQGVPASITQIYLVFTSVILAWHLSHFDEWTAWTLLCMLALYDLCAVLTPCGPLKALVNLMQEDDSPDMPGLLYEAELPAGTQRPGVVNSKNNANKRDKAPDNTTLGHSQTNEASSDYVPPTANLTASVAATATSSNAENSSPHESNNPPTPRRRRRNSNRIIQAKSRDTKPQSSTTHRRDDDKKPSATTDPSTPSSPLTDTIRVSLPLAIARVYRLKLVSNYGAPASNADHVAQLSSKETRKRRSARSRTSQKIKGHNNGIEDGSLTVNPSPLLADWERSTSTNEFYQSKFSVKELTSIVEVEMPRHGGRIEKGADSNATSAQNSSSRRSKDAESRYNVIGRNGDIKRVLTVNRRGEVYEIQDEDDDESDDGSYDEGPPSIRLGLGDFIFYSVLVAKAAMYSFTTFAACILVIMAGLGGTLLMLSVYHSALPALPISIFFGVIFYLLTRLIIEPWIEVVMITPLYV